MFLKSKCKCKTSSFPNMYQNKFPKNAKISLFDYVCNEISSNAKLLCFFDFNWNERDQCLTQRNTKKETKQSALKSLMRTKEMCEITCSIKDSKCKRERRQSLLEILKNEQQKSKIKVGLQKNRVSSIQKTKYF
jgi:hypothetical protein